MPRELPLGEAPPLVRDNIGLAYWQAGKTKIREEQGETYEDVVADCLVALWKAAETFDPSKGFTFGTYAVACMWREVARNRKRQKILSAKELAEARAEGNRARLPAVSLSMPITTGSGDEVNLIDALPDPHNEIDELLNDAETRTLRVWLEDQIACLPSLRDARIMRKLLTGMSAEAVAAEEGLTRQSVYNVREKAVSTLRGRAEAAGMIA